MEATPHLSPSVMPAITQTVIATWLFIQMLPHSTFCAVPISTTSWNLMDGKLWSAVELSGPFRGSRQPFAPLSLSLFILLYLYLKCNVQCVLQRDLSFWAHAGNFQFHPLTVCKRSYKQVLVPAGDDSRTPTPITRSYISKKCFQFASFVCYSLPVPTRGSMDTCVWRFFFLQVHTVWDTIHLGFFCHHRLTLTSYLQGPVINRLSGAAASTVKHAKWIFVFSHAS